jgi:hypothetical protein
MQWVSPKSLRKIVWQPEEISTQYHHVLYSGTGDDTHEKIWRYTRDDHH